MKKGKLIVVDGIDGSGKKTQVGILVERLKKEGHKVVVADFPEYENNFFGKFIGHCLTEQYYNWRNIHPKIASIAYAADRWESSAKIKDFLDKGYVIVANRYVSSNQIHQGGKISSAKKRQDFIEWLDTMEHGVFKIPRPNIVLYLSLPLQVALRLIDKRAGKMKREYLKKKKDVHENDVMFLQNSRRAALWLTKTQKNWMKIECLQNGQLARPEVIHEEIYKIVKKIIKK